MSRGKYSVVRAMIFICLSSAVWVGSIYGCANGGGKSASMSATAQEGVVYYIDDHLGNTHLVTDSLGNVLHEESRYPYGLERQVQGPGFTVDGGVVADYVYTGKEYDEETGLIYFGGRYYSPELGRWVTADPLFLENDPKKSIERPLELNLYSYVRNNPTTFVDAEGYKILHLKNASQQYKDDFNSAYKYLDAAGLAGPLKALDQRKEIVYLRESNNHTDQFVWEKGKYYIDWDSRSGLNVSKWPSGIAFEPDSNNNTVQTPALGVLHEAAHAEGFFSGTMLSQDEIPQDPFENKEERRVITQIETPAARVSDEPIRHYYGGFPVRVGCPTCKK